VVAGRGGQRLRHRERFAEQLLKHNGHPKAITQIAIDMSPAYQKGVRENFGNAQIVFDKFHVVSQVVQAVEEVRRKEARQDAQAREQLERTSWFVAQESRELDGGEQERWTQLQDKPLVTGLAYAMRLNCKRRMRPGRWARRAAAFNFGVAGCGPRRRH